MNYITVQKYAQLSDDILMLYELKIAKCEIHSSSPRFWFGKEHWLDLLLMFKPLAQEYLSQRKAQSFKPSSNNVTQHVKIMKENSNLIFTCYCFKEKTDPDYVCLTHHSNPNKRNNKVKDEDQHYRQTVVSRTYLSAVVFPICCPVNMGASELKRILGVQATESLDLSSYYFQPVLQACSKTDLLQDESTNMKAAVNCSPKDKEIVAREAFFASKEKMIKVKSGCTDGENVNDNSKISGPVEEKIQKDLSQIQVIKDLLDDHILYLLRTNEIYLKDMFRGKINCRRHQDYKEGGKQRGNLNYQVYMTLFTDSQIELIMDYLVSIFCRNNNKFLDYVIRVLLPETLIKIAMELYKLPHDKAEDLLIQDIYKS